MGGLMFKRHVVISSLLALSLVASTARPASAFVTPSVGTVVWLGDALQGAATDVVGPAMDALSSSATVAQMGAADPTAGGVLVAARTAAGFATFSVPALATAAPWVAGGLVGGLVGYLLASQFLDPDKGKVHPTNPTIRFLADTASGTGGGIEVQLGTQKAAEDLWTAMIVADPSQADPAKNWGCGSGHDGFIAATNASCGGTATIVYQCALLYAGSKSTLTYKVAGVEASGPTVAGTGVRLNTSSPYFFTNVYGLTAGQTVTYWEGGTAYRSFSNSVSWNVYGGSGSDITPKALTPAGVKSLTDMTNAEQSRKVHAAPDPWVAGFGNPAQQVTPPVDNSISAPPVLYQDPGTGAWKVSPHGLPAGDDGKPTTAAPRTFDPATGKMDTETASPSPSPTSSPTTAPSPAPTKAPISWPSSTTSQLQSESFVQHFFSRMKTCAPFDWFADAAVAGDEQDLEYTAFKDKSYEGVDIQQTWSFNWAKPLFKGIVAISVIGLGVVSLLWI